IRPAQVDPDHQHLRPPERRGPRPRGPRSALLSRPRPTCTTKVTATRELTARSERSVSRRTPVHFPKTAAVGSGPGNPWAVGRRLRKSDPPPGGGHLPPPW